MNVGPKLVDGRCLRVMIVDGCTVSRRELADSLAVCEGVEVVGTAIRASTALGKMPSYRPDVVLIDISSAEVGGLDLARRLQSFSDIGVVLAADDFASAEAARKYGGLARCSAVARRKQVRGEGALVTALRSAWRDRARRATAPKARAVVPVSVVAESPRSPPAKPRARAVVESSSDVQCEQQRYGHRKAVEVVALCTSTGGPDALTKMLPMLPANFSRPILVVQHMPPGFTASLAASLDRICALSVREATDGEPVEAGSILLAPGGRHLGVVSRDRGVVTALSNAPPENSCRPAADYMLRSLTQVYGGGVLTVMMTGMGEDGLAGCRELHGLGAAILAQDEASCTVFGMPRGPVTQGLASVVAPLDSLSTHICRATAQGVL